MKGGCALNQPKRLAKNAERLTSNKLVIYIVDLKPNTTETDLTDYFSKYGTVKGARVMIDNITGQCLGYGHVTFADRGAIEEGGLLDSCHFLNGSRIKVLQEMPAGYGGSSQSQVQSADRDTNTAKVAISKRNIYVGGLKLCTTKDDLLAYFSKFGTVQQTRIITDRDTGLSRGFGFVTFSDPKTLEGGVLEANHFIDGCRLIVEPAILPSGVPRVKPSEKKVKQNVTPIRLCLQSLPPDITEASLHEYFSRFGIVKDVGLLTEVSCLGRGFVVFHDLDAVSKVMESQPHKLYGKQITVSSTEDTGPTDTGSGSHSKENMNPGKIFLGSLPKNVTECRLYKYFSNFGIVMDVSISKECKFNGCGFVDFRDLDSAKQVLDSQPHKLNETEISIRLANKQGSAVSA